MPTARRGRAALLSFVLALVAFAWGLAEATVFFIVPDVVITFAAIFSRRCAALALGAALAGALVGGAVMYAWEDRQPGAAATIVEQTPGVRREMLDRAERQLRRGLWRGPGGSAAAMLAGGVSLMPFKTYAVSAPLAGLSLPTFLACAGAARGLRFGLTALVARSVVTGPLRAQARWRQVLAHLGVWTAVYAAYFAWLSR